MATTSITSIHPHLPPPLVNFGAQNEDAHAELALLSILHQRQQRPLRVLCVASVGTHCFTMSSLEHVVHIDAVDMVAAQLRASKLVFAAGRTLSPADFEVFYGNAEGTGETRLRLYDANVRAALPSDDDRMFWDQHRDTIAVGLFVAGGAERIYRTFRSQLQLDMPNALSSPDEWKALAAHPERISAAVAAAWSVELLKAAFVLPENVIVMLAASLSAPLKVRFARRVVDIANEKLAPNAFDELLFCGHITSGIHTVSNRLRTAPAPFLTVPVIESAKQRLNSGAVQVAFHEGPAQVVASRLCSESGRLYDLIDLSNIFDMLPSVDMFKSVLSSFVPCLAPGGCVLLRYSGGDANDKTEIKLPELFAAVGLQNDEAVNRELAANDRSFIIVEIAAGFAASPK